MNCNSILSWFYGGLALFVWLIFPSTALAQEEYPKGAFYSHSRAHEFAQEIGEGFDYTFRVVGYGNVFEPNNKFLEGRRYTVSGDFRPDFSLDYRSLRLLAKPRVRILGGKWEDNTVFEDEWDFEDEWFVNEWLASLGLTNNLYVSYGRENLQWGPSYLFSPSNPFFKANFRTNPLAELPGLEFARLLWVINPAWTISLIANVDEGRLDFPLGFEQTYALKLDFTGDRKYFSLIPSKREGDRGQLGAFAGWNVTDALMLHGEMSLFHGINPQYQLNQLEKSGILGPLNLPTNPDVDKYTDSEIETLLLVGSSYTFTAGPTVTLEYVYNSAGLNDEQADRLDEEILRRFNLASSLFGAFADPLPEFLGKTGEILFPSLTFFRRNYLMLQYQQSQIWNIINVLLRYTYNLDDHSSRLTPVISFDIGRHARLYFVGRKNFGSEDTEFQYLYDYSFTVGLEYTF